MNLPLGAGPMCPLPASSPHTVEPLVSVIMPTFNSSAYVGAAIQSVLEQDFPGWELIVVDDGSTDGTIDIVKSCERSDPRIKVICLVSNQGAAEARNQAICLARGRYIAFLDSDDLWHRRKLSVQLNAFSDTGAVLVFSGFDVIKEQGDKIIRSVRVPGRIGYAELCRANPIGCLTAIYDTRSIGKVFMPNIRMRQDWGLWLRILRGGSFAVGLPMSLATLRLHRSSMSANKLRAVYYNYRLLRTEAGLGVLRSMLGVVTNLVRAVGYRM